VVLKVRERSLKSVKLTPLCSDGRVCHHHLKNQHIYLDYMRDRDGMVEESSCPSTLEIASIILVCPDPDASRNGCIIQPEAQRA
jgi:hypothetical protein